MINEQLERKSKAMMKLAIAQEIVNAIKKSLTKIIFDLLARDKDKI